MEQFYNTLFGGMQPPVFLALFLLAMFGSFLRVAIRAEKARAKAPNTPVRFSGPFFFYNNILKLSTCIGTNAIAILMLHAAGGDTIAATSAFFVGFAGGEASIRLSKLREKAPRV
nr:hypothetical protein [uncultured Flavobacterium sp.]